MSKKPPPSYADNPLWASITPILLRTPADPNHDLASIAYSDHYLEATSYLRAVMATNEISQRALDLTADVIGMNPAHYTVWLYRAKVVVGLGEKEEEGEEGKEGALEKRLRNELEWLNVLAKKYLKNYQIWHHRQLIVSRLSAPPASELSDLTDILSLDTKNYHVWTYRQWLVRHFALWDSEPELASTASFISSDVRNNSAWTHRFYLLFGRRGIENDGRDRLVIDEDLVDREVEYAKGKVWDAPQNQSPWSYLGGVMKHADRRQSEERAFAEQFVDFEEGGKGVGSSFALEWLAECARESGDVELGRKALGALRDTYDPIRKGYWEWRMTELEGEGKDDGKGAGEGVSKAGGPVLRPKRPGESGHGPVVRV